VSRPVSVFAAILPAYEDHGFWKSSIPFLLNFHIFIPIGIDILHALNLSEEHLIGPSMFFWLALSTMGPGHIVEL
jgi:hypothetical protein